MDVTFRIRRYNPEAGKKPYWQEFSLNNVTETDRVLELMHRIKWEQDGSLAFRRSCSHGICGSDAMRINGRNALACKLLIRDVGQKVQIEPILGLPVMKDLIVDMEPFFDHYRSVMRFPPMGANGCKRRKIANASTTRPTAFCAPAARLPVPASGAMANMLAQQRLSRRIVSSSTAAIRRHRNGLRHWLNRMAYGAAGRFSTAPRPAPVIFRSHARLARSSWQSSAAHPKVLST